MVDGRSIAAGDVLSQLSIHRAIKIAGSSQKNVSIDEIGGHEVEAQLLLQLSNSGKRPAGQIDRYCAFKLEQGASFEAGRLAYLPLNGTSICDTILGNTGNHEATVMCLLGQSRALPLAAATD